MAINGIYHVNINCRDLERSRAFYKSLGFTGLVEFPRAVTRIWRAALASRPCTFVAS